MIIWKVEYGSYQIWNESKIMSIAKEEESDCDSNNESLEATNVWQRMAIICKKSC